MLIRHKHTDNYNVLHNFIVKITKVMKSKQRNITFYVSDFYYQNIIKVQTEKFSSVRKNIS